MRKFLILISIFGTVGSFAQKASDNWDLRHCIEHAIEYNISIKQADIQARIAALQAKQAKYNQYPNANGSTGTGLRFGRSIDPTTNNFATSQFLYQNFGINAGVQLYNDGRLKNTALVAQFNAQAALQDVAKASYDISFNVATYYLQVLAAKEQLTISSIQISQSQNQFEITKKRVDAGVLPELNLAEVEAQLANDSSNYYTARGNYEQNLLNLRALLNLDTDVLFGIETPMVDQIPLEPLADLQPEIVYETGLQYQPLQKANEFRIKSAQKNILVSRSQKYPTLSLGGNLSTSFSNSFKTTTGVSFLGYTPVTGVEPIVNVSNVNYYVQYPIYKTTQSTRGFGQLWDDWGKQIDNNFGQNIGLSLSIPIFNNNQAKTNIKVAQLNLKSAELQKTQSDLTLKQNIYTAYTNAITALQKFNAGKKTVESNQKAYDYALKRYDAGLLSALDLITNQNNLLKAKVLQLTNQYDYVFKMKLLEFYKGKGLKL
ncbi:MAG: hypothetical protein RLZZ28_2608 [Bacteroidota bacterium]